MMFFFDLCLNQQFNKQWRRWCFETLPCSLWRHCNAFDSSGPVFCSCFDSSDPVTTMLGHNTAHDWELRCVGVCDIVSWWDNYHETLWDDYHVCKSNTYHTSFWSHWAPKLFLHDDIIKWKHFPPYWPFVRGIHQSPVKSPHKGHWRGALMFSLICWINDFVSNHAAGDFRPHHTHYDVTVMQKVPHDLFQCEVVQIKEMTGQLILHSGHLDPL